MAQNRDCHEKEEFNFLSEEVGPQLHNRRDWQSMREQGHKPLYDVKIVLEADSAKVSE